MILWSIWSDVGLHFREAWLLTSKSNCKVNSRNDEEIQVGDRGDRFWDLLLFISETTWSFKARLNIHSHFTQKIIFNRQCFSLFPATIPGNLWTCTYHLPGTPTAPFLFRFSRRQTHPPRRSSSFGRGFALGQRNPFLQTYKTFWKTMDKANLSSSVYPEGVSKTPVFFSRLRHDKWRKIVNISWQSLNKPWVFNLPWFAVFGQSTCKGFYPLQQTFDWQNSVGAFGILPSSQNEER